MKSISLPLIYFVFFSLYLQGQSSNNTILKEMWYDKTPVSGDIRVGIISEFDSTKISPDTRVYYAYLPDESLKGLKLCTVISSRDGRYKGELTTDLNEEMRGRINDIEWNSKHIEELANMKKNEITILSMVAKTCDSDPKFYTLSQWNKKKSENFYVILNSEKKPKIKIKGEKIDGSPCICTKLDGETNVNYNYKCLIPFKKLIGKFEMNVVQTVIRLSNVTSVNYPIVNLKLPINE